MAREGSRLRAEGGDSDAQEGNTGAAAVRQDVTQRRKDVAAAALTGLFGVGSAGDALQALQRARPCPVKYDEAFCAGCPSKLTHFSAELSSASANDVEDTQRQKKRRRKEDDVLLCWACTRTRGRTPEDFDLFYDLTDAEYAAAVELLSSREHITMPDGPGRSDEPRILKTPAHIPQELQLKKEKKQLQCDPIQHQSDYVNLHPNWGIADEGSTMLRTRQWHLEQADVPPPWLSRTDNVGHTLVLCTSRDRNELVTPTLFHVDESGAYTSLMAVAGQPVGQARWVFVPPAAWKERDEKGRRVMMNILQEVIGVKCILPAAYDSTRKITRYLQENSAKVEQDLLNRIPGARVLVQKPGDTVYVPVGWGHAVFSERASCKVATERCGIDDILGVVWVKGLAREIANAGRGKSKREYLYHQDAVLYLVQMCMHTEWVPTAGVQ